MSDPLPWLILLPLAWALLSFVLGPGRGATAALTGMAVQLFLAVLLAMKLAAVPRDYAIGGWGAPLGIDLRVDGLAAVMLLLSAAVSLPVAVHARAYFASHPREGRYFWPLTGFLLTAMNGLYLSADLFNVYVTLELLGLAAVGLVAAGGGAGQVTAGLRYLLVTLLGSGAYLMGVALVYGIYGSVSLSTLTPLLAAPAPVAAVVAAALMLTGLLLKTALFPFHFWLPPAHGGAPAPVSALLSALVVKASFYLVLRLWLGIFAPLATRSAAELLGALGAGAILWGSYQAIRAPRLKTLVAYSTVAQLGYLFLIFPLLWDAGTGAAAGAYQGVMLHTVSHALAKAAMFAAAGTILLSLGRDEVAGLAGISTRLPVTLFAFALASVTLMGLPPSGGFVAKWLLVAAALRGGQWGWAVIVILGGLLSAAYVFRVLRQAFLPVPEAVSFRRVPRALEWSAFALAVASFLPGLRAAELLDLLGPHEP